MAYPTLVQFRASHYNEKARWALDYKGIPHLRRTLLPGKHMGEARQLTGQTALPILILNGKAIHDSTRIIAALEEVFPNPPLYPRDAALRRRALELEDFFDEELGPHARRLFFVACLPHTVYMAHVFDAEENFLSRWLYRGLLALMKSRLSRRMRLDPESVENSRQKVQQALSRLEQEIQPSGYLVGDDFSVADLTAAAMLSVVARPPERQDLPSRPRPRTLQELENQFKDRPAYKWVRDIYRRHRGPWIKVPVSPPATQALASAARLRAP